ncbi:hypothetical protein Tco_1521754, partial [Tanacetum coccineum]
SLIEQFWQIAALSTTEDGVHAIIATIDGRDNIITEASIRRHLKLQDSEGLSSFPNAEIFEQLARISTPTTPPSIQITHEAEETATMPHVSPLPRGHIPRSDEVGLESEEIREASQDVETQEKNSADTEVLLEETTPTELIEDLGSGEKGEKEISTANVPVSTAGAEVSTASTDVSTAAAALVYIRRSASKAKEKGKGIMTEPEPPKKLKKRVQVQLTVDEDLAKKLFEEERARFNAEQEARAKEEQEQEMSDFEVAQELQRQLDERQEVPAKPTQAHKIDWNDPGVL